jgi:uncharacterized protein YxeA
MYLFIFVLNILSFGLGQTPLPLNSPPASIALDATNNIQLFVINNACSGPNLYTVTAQSFNQPCFTMVLFDQNNQPVPIAPPLLDKQTNGAGNIIVFIRKPNGGTPGCTQESIQLTFLTGSTGNCQGQITVDSSNVAMSDINTLNQTLMPLQTTQYAFFQFNNLLVGSSYVLLVEMTPDSVNPYIDNAIPYPTQYNCHDFIGIPGTNNRFKVFTPTLSTLNIGLNAMNPIKYSIQTYVANTVTLALGNGAFPTQLDSSKFNFYNLPQAMGNMGSITITNANVPLMLFLSNTQDTTQFTGGTPITIAANAAPQTIPLNGQTFATVYNPVQNVATAMYSIQISNTPGQPIPQMPTLAPAIVQNTMVLAIPLYAIIVICVGIVLLIAGLITSLYVYNKRKSQKKRDYKPVATAKKESTSTSSSQDDTESSDYTDDSYEEPRQYSRRQQRNRSYDDDEDDYDSSDYS